MRVTMRILVDGAKQVTEMDRAHEAAGRFIGVLTRFRRLPTAQEKDHLLGRMEELTQAVLELKGMLERVNLR